VSTGISWAQETVNVLAGCKVHGDDCRNCYAMREAWRMAHNPITPQYRGTVRKVHGRPVWTGQVNLAEHALEKPLGWRRPTMIFVGSMSDLFYERVPDEWVVRIFDMMRQAPQHAYLVLTKRPERVGATLERIGQAIPASCWLGASIGRQRYMARVEALRQIEAPVRFISAEPLLGPLELDLTGIDWVICGGESGPRSRIRRFDPDWARSIRDQCRHAGTAFHMKQMSGSTKRELHAIPADLMIRQYPTTP
jgi:protein gp37